MPGFYSELRRRNVARVGVAYLVVAWLLLQIADTLASALHLPDWVTPFVIMLLVIGFIPAMIFTWVFEVTPDGIVRTSDIDANQPVSAASSRKLNYVTIAAVVAAVAILLWTSTGPTPPEESAFDASIAVLPFVNMSGHKENEYFSDGLTETLLHMLAQNPDLRVSARTSSFAFKNKDIDVREIAGRLGVAHILEGSVQRVEDQVRITVQLIRASDGSHLWSKKYDRTLDDIFLIHDEISVTVGTELTKSLLGDRDPVIPEGLATRDIEAFDLYLRALPQIAIGSYESFRNAEELLKNALVKDPNFTDAKAKLAENYIHQADTGITSIEVGLAKAVPLFNQVLTEQPTNVNARVSLVLIEMFEGLISGNLGARTAAIEQLLVLVHESPNNVEARMQLAATLWGNSKREEAIVQFEKAVSLDPLNAFLYEMLANRYVILREWDAAREHINRSLEIEPLQPNAAKVLADIYRATGGAAEFIRQMQKVIELDPLDYEYPFAIAQLLYELGLVDEGDQFAKTVMAIAPNSPAAQKLRIVRAIRADSEEESLAVARQMIREDTDDRRGAWFRAFRHLMLTAVLRDRTESELEFVSEYVPGFADFDVTTLSWRAGVGRAHTLEIWRDLDTQQGVLDRVDVVLAAFARLELPVARVQIVNIDILLLQGDLEAAIDAALSDLFSESVLEHMAIKDRFVTPLYAEFVADPRIDAALKKWRDEVATNREDVRGYLADNK